MTYGGYLEQVEVADKRVEQLTRGISSHTPPPSNNTTYQHTTNTLAVHICYGWDDWLHVPDKVSYTTFSPPNINLTLIPTLPFPERRELIAKNLEENKERMELSQKLMLCEKECSGNLSLPQPNPILAYSLIIILLDINFNIHTLPFVFVCNRNPSTSPSMVRIEK